MQFSQFPIFSNHRMRKIDIITTQNVTIEYELATVKERIASTFFDFIIILILSIIIFSFSTLFPKAALQYYHIFIPASFIYYLLFESLYHGQTIGKKIMKIRVIKINGDRPVFFDFLMRTIFSFLDLFISLGTLAIIMISASSKGQRLGDYFADTTVVRLINLNNFSISRILSMEKLKNYTPKYPQVTKFSEEDMLLIKEALESVKRYPNTSHYEAIDMLVEKIEGQLELAAPKDKIVFLNELIKDYVSLTR